MFKVSFRIVPLLLAAFLTFTVSAYARDWSTTDTDLPPRLQGMSQDQLNIVNKTNELNPSHPNFNPSLLNLFAQATRQPLQVRDASGGTSVLQQPPVNILDDIGGVPTGIGAPPAASDGPVTHPGLPTGVANPNTRTEGPGASRTSPQESATNAEALGLFFGPFFSEEFAKDLEDEEAFWDYYSGSGGLFGDCVGADCIPAFGYPGHPVGGLPVGSWVHHDRSFINNRFISDSTALSAVQAGNFNQAASLLSTALGGQEVRHDPRGRGF